MFRRNKTEIININLENIHPNPNQPRKNFSEEGLQELAQSISTYGVLQPIIVRRKAKNTFEIIAGERRWRAAKFAGLSNIPAIIKDSQDEETAVMAMIENLQREDLNFLEEAEGYHKLINDYNITQEELANKVGKSQSTIANKLRLLKLPEEVKKIISQKNLSERHARSLLKIPEKEIQLEVLKQVYEKGLNVRQTEILIERILERELQKNKKERLKKIKRAYKDIRLFLNSLKKLVENIQQTGLDANYKATDKGDHVEVVVYIPKK
ncbi:MAG: ParB family transcriptional regulator, chromosome partitioning protein [Thermosediminibacterales bacterium]|nr:ParB family transcriptional regulator, chromosome partitioning protein [Thermosediminibacterales bacterium]MDK2835697.1 ParB family transcriptional regulator, chromosome partitioning protein [Thermosediminibacterales bacterium]